MTSEGALCEAIAAAGKILFFTGAGISTPSGIPDFRGPQGVWKKRDPVFYQDFMSSEDSRIDYWEYKLEGWAAFQKAMPNAVHDAIALIEKAGKLDLVVTQNVKPRVALLALVVLAFALLVLARQALHDGS